MNMQKVVEALQMAKCHFRAYELENTKEYQSLYRAITFLENEMKYPTREEISENVSDLIAHYKTEYDDANVIIDDLHVLQKFINTPKLLEHLENVKNYKIDQIREKLLHIFDKTYNEKTDGVPQLCREINTILESLEER